MKQAITKLANGLRVVTSQMAESSTVAVSLMAGVGSRYEQLGVNGGVSHFLEHLLWKGTERRPSTKALAEEIDGVGGVQNAYTTNDLTSFYIKVPLPEAALALDVLADMAQHPLLDPAEIDRERPVVLAEMSDLADDPIRSVLELVQPLLWPGDPVSQPILGSEAVIRRIARDQIAEFQERYYGPNNLVVSV